MIVVRVELHSAVTGAVTELGQAFIGNDETGTAEFGNYDVELYSDDAVEPCRGRVEKYERKTRPIWPLVERALSSALPMLPLNELTKKLSRERGESSLFIAEIRAANGHADASTHAMMNDKTVSRVAILRAFVVVLRSVLANFEAALAEELKKS